MNNSGSLRDFGRLRYVEPTNIYKNREGTYSDAINFPYEDYNIAVDLTIRQSNRYSCGWWTEDGNMTEYKYSSECGTISFLGGTRGYSSLNNQDEGYLTTNFTDISMMNPETNTSECLGIESINITYNSWMYPQVVIKFVDVRGSTVMLPAEKDYYNSLDAGNASNIYKSLFSFPYPMFILKVKGFYGKGVTYRLAVHKTDFEFDANTGNFNITVDFIGYMFGIYSEIPLTFLAASPFMDNGREYWKQKINSGEFTFKDNGNDKGVPMVTLPELKLKLAQVANNEEAISAASEGEEMSNMYDQRLEAIVSIKDSFPFNNWFNSMDTSVAYGFFKTIEETHSFIDTISEYVSSVSKYDETYNTQFLSKMTILTQINDIVTNKYGGDKEKILKYLGRIHFINQNVNGKNIAVIDEKSEWVANSDNNFNGLVYGNSPKEMYERYISSSEQVKNYIEKNRGALTDYYIIMLPFGDGMLNTQQFFNSINEEHSSIVSQKEEQVKYYKNKENSIIEKVLGFKPSIKNIYDLLFAHMDTFTYCFYESTKIIKDQLENQKTKREKSYFDVKDGETDTEREKLKKINGEEVINTNARCKYLPPYAAFYKESYEGNGSSAKMVLRWPGEKRNGNTLEEVIFVNNLLKATEMYSEQSSNIVKQIESMNANSDKSMFDGFNYNTPSLSVNNFIPSTTFDFINKDKTGNPYQEIANKVYDGDNSLNTDLLTIFALRAFYYLSINDGKHMDDNDAKVFGKIESLNVFKSVGDKYSDNFIKFIKTYSEASLEWFNKFIENTDSAKSDSWSSLTDTWKTSAENLNDTLFKFDGGNSNLVYNYHKGFSFTTDEINEDGVVKDSLNKGKPYTAKANKEYKMFPLACGGVAKVQNYYLKDKNMFHNYAMIPTEYDDVIYGGDNCEVSTFVIYDGVRDYIKNIYAAIENEITSSKDEITKFNPEYKDSINYSSLSKSSYVLREYNENVKNGLGVSSYDLETISKENGEKFKEDEINKIITEGTRDDLKQLWIKTPTVDFTNNSKDGESIFLHPLYKAQTDIKAKAYLFIQSIPIFDKNNGIESKNKNGLTLKSKLLREGAYYWYEDNFDKVVFNEKYQKPLKNETLMTEYGEKKSFGAIRILTNNQTTEHYSKWEKPSGFTASRKRVLKKFFEDWAISTNDDNGFAANEARLRNVKLYSRSVKTECNLSIAEIRKKVKEGGAESDYLNGEDTRHLNNGLDIVFLTCGDKKTPEVFEARKLQCFLRDLFFGVCTAFDLYNGISDKNGIMKVNTQRLKSAFSGFMEGLSGIYSKTITDRKENATEYQEKIVESQGNNPFNSMDVKLATYMTLKSLYDKWLCTPYNGPRDTWVLTRDKNSKSDFDSFKYVDTYYNDISYSLLVNVSKVSNWLDSCMPSSNLNTSEGIMCYMGRSLYEFLTQVAEDCGGMLIALPQKFGLSSMSDVKDMFTPISIKDEWDEDSSSFIFVYTYKPSEYLGDSETSNVDMNGWSPYGDGLDLTDDELVGKILNNSENSFTIPAFAVTNGKQNQSIFKNIQLTTKTQGVTEAAIAATMNIASKGSESPRESTLYGQDLYRVFTNYSYQCRVETMGNVQIMPVMYFQLNNIPLWRGAYMIKKVTHNINGGNMTTSFEGIRINRYAIPISDGTVIISKQTGDEVSKSDFTDNAPTTGPDGQVAKPTGNEKGNPNAQLVGTEDFDGSKISKTTPLICITPAHGPQTQKSFEWGWSTKVVDRMAEILRGYKYSNGEPYQVQRCNKNGANTGTYYSLKETYALVKKYGSECVVSLVPHWNGCGGRRFISVKGGIEDYTRPDSIKLLECIAEEAKLVKEKRSSFKTLPIDSKGNDAMSGTVTVEHFPSRKKVDKKTGVEYMDHKSSDGATMPKCACALTENWYADFPSKEGYERTSRENKLGKNSDGRYKYMSGWLYSAEGVETIAQLNAKGIKRYIDGLS